MSEAKKSKAQVFGARLFSTALLAVIVSGTFLSKNAWAFMGLIAFLGICASIEYFNMTRLGKMPAQRKWGIVLGASYLFGIGAVLASKGADGLAYLAGVDSLAIAIVVLGSFILQLREKIDGAKPMIAVAVTILGFLYIPYLFGYMARLCFLPEGNGEGISGAWLLLWTVLVTKSTDMGAYVTGSLIGKNKMIPHISPGKTWEGFFGAIVISMGVACGVYALQPEALSVLGGWGHVIGLSLAVALLTVVGDLAESLIKRSLQVKDSGNSLPGIGGALDLIDSLCFTAPAVYLYITWLV